MNTTDTQFDRLAELTQEAVDALKAAIERAEAAEAKCEQLRKQRDLFWSQRDALQARIDAGVRVWGIGSFHKGGTAGIGRLQGDKDTHTGILLEWQPITQDHIADAGKMVDDDRKGKVDRREGYAHGSCWRINQTDDTRGKYRTAVPNTRRCTPGTKADRKPSWTRADGSTTPRTGERRVEGSWEYCFCHQLLEPSCHKNMDYCWRPTSGDGTFAQDNRRDPSGANDRRRK